MSRLLWGFGWAGVIVWSIACLITYGVLDFAGGWAARNADLFSSDPEVVEWIWRVFSWLHSLSTGAVLVTWGLVSLLILAVPWTLDRMVGRAPARTAPAAGRPDGRMIDLEPGQYSVGPAAGAARPGPAPRIPPRA